MRVHNHGFKMRASGSGSLLILDCIICMTKERISKSRTANTSPNLRTFNMKATDLGQLK